MFRSLETFSLYFQGGVRRSIIIFFGACMILLAPFYFLGQLGSTVWYASDFNPNKLVARDIVIPKKVEIADYELDRTQIVPLINEENVLYTTINNLNNTEAGFYPFVYRLQVLDQNGAIVSEERKQTYLLPGEIKYVVANQAGTQGAEIVVVPEPETKVIPFNPNRKQAAESVKLQIRNPQVIPIPDSEEINLQALIKNEGLVDVHNVDLLYLVRDDRDRVVGIGEFQVEKIATDQTIEFNINYPLPRFRTPTRLDLRTTVNYLDSASISLN